MLNKNMDKNYAIKQELFGQGDNASGVDFFQFDVMTPHSQIIDYNFIIKFHQEILVIIMQLWE